MEKARGYLNVAVLEGRNIRRNDHSLLSFLEATFDPWVEVVLEGRIIVSSRQHDNEPNPKFNVRTTVPYCYASSAIAVNIYDSNFAKSYLIGNATIALSPLDRNWSTKNWYPLGSDSGEVLVDVSFEAYTGPAAVLHPEPLGLQSYFPARKGGKLELFQDAETSSSRNFPSASPLRKASDCFAGIMESIQYASEYIYICGWSLWTDLKLIRGTPSAETLGELLIRKANEGVTVLILIWSEKLSAGLCPQLFGTHDVQTVKYFKGTRAICKAVLREPVDRKNLTFDERIHTHHMKLVVMDDARYVTVGYIGGIDMTDGRWDYPDHPLWETLGTLHKGDFYNGFANVEPHNGPREPWHDIHAKVVGATAQDLMTMIEERWRRQMPKYTSKLVPRPSAPPNVSSGTDRRQWNVQILRSSDSDSSLYKKESAYLYDIAEATVDYSVYYGHVNLIRSARKFIYIETQYFLGASYAWIGGYYDTVAQNVVPAELAEQICYGISHNSPIRVYIVIPIAPEGNSSDTIGCAYMTDILLWQFLTIKMMYQRIALAITKAGLDHHPEDYLLFLCLGQKLSRSFVAKSIADGAVPDGWQERRRFPIYVHSKMILADDARIIVGSANMNQRSMDGRRDTECAVAGSETTDEGRLVTTGEVARFRKSLWYEHTEGQSESREYADPSSVDCIRHLKAKSLEAFKNYIDDSFEANLQYRFLKYPLEVTQDGQCTAIPGMPNIPDLNIPVMGKKSFIPAIITT